MNGSDKITTLVGSHPREECKLRTSQLVSHCSKGDFAMYNVNSCRRLRSAVGSVLYLVADICKSNREKLWYITFLLGKVNVVSGSEDAR